MPESRQKYQRFPAVPRTISSVNVETDIRVRILGRIVDKLSDGFVLQDLDGTQAEIRHEKPLTFEAGSLVRAFCRVLPLETGFELHAELVQPAQGLDLELYKKVFMKEAKEL